GEAFCQRAALLAAFLLAVARRLGARFGLGREQVRGLDRRLGARPGVDRLDRGVREARAGVRRRDLGLLLVVDVLERVVLVREGFVDLRLRDGHETVLEEPARQRRTRVLPEADAALVVRAHDQRLVRLVPDQLPALVLVHGLV